MTAARRHDVIASTIADVVRSAGGWLFDRAMVGWDVVRHRRDTVGQISRPVMTIEAGLVSILCLSGRQPSRG
jgi:uncharacterized membrane protein